MNPVIITCAITGAETTKQNQPALPVTPDEQAQAAFECVQAGASVIHLHVRNDDQSPSQSVERFKEVQQKIKKLSPGVIIQFSTGGAVGEKIENRIAPLALRPEMASLNLGTLNFGDDVFMNHPRDILKLASEIKKQAIVPELEVYEAGMLEVASRYLKDGVLNNPFHFQFVLGVLGGMSGDIKNLMHLISLLPKNSTWGVAGVGRFQLAMANFALLLGGNVRVGFEDNIYYRKGQLAKSNTELVSRVVRLANELDRKVASVAQARELLGIVN